MKTFTLLPESAADTGGRGWSGCERHLANCSAQSGGGVGLVWCGGDGIVVPRSYCRAAGFADACARLLSDGLPVHIRLTGGGVVPQSPETVNLQLAYPATAAQPMQAAERHYLMLCRLLQKLFAAFGIETGCQAVSGSFCDGRFNLAHRGRKIAGTAQYWQRRPDTDNGYTVLSSAVVVAGDSRGLTERANLFEAALGSGVRYLPEKTVAVKELCGAGAGEVCAVLRSLLAQEAVFE